VDLAEVMRRVVGAERIARRILSAHEASASRVVTIEDTYKRLGKLSISQDDLFRQALRAIEHQLYRSAIVMAWAAFMDFAEEELGQDGFNAVNARYTAWKISDVEDLRDKVNDYQIVEALGSVKLCTKGAKKSLHGMLSTRNECAHPSDFFPGLNDAMGFVSQVLQRIETMKGKIPRV